MSVRQNLSFALEKGQGKTIIDELIEMTELGDLQNRKPHTLSGGQQQRVALARALVRRPELLRLDEPLSALDAGMRNKLQDYLLQVHQRYGLTTLLVTHRPE
jgi:molybdate transport system ATP-binding protein